MAKKTKKERSRAKSRAAAAAATASDADSIANVQSPGPSDSAADEGAQNADGTQNNADDGMQTAISQSAEGTQNAASASNKFNFAAQNEEGMQNPEGTQNAASATNETTEAQTGEGNAITHPNANSLPVTNNQDAAATLPQIVHNKQCETCGFGGRMICCSACNLVFHWGCTRPQLVIPPVGHWFCPYCIASDSSATEMEKQSATLFAEEINNLKREAMLKRNSPTTDEDVPSTKRLRSSPSQNKTETATENNPTTNTDEANAVNNQPPTRDNIPNDAKIFVDLFFLKGKAKQE
ncbi:hypothetical protein ACHAXR_000504, partial [Thalassiosira sp. AJA248-18]